MRLIIALVAALCVDSAAAGEISQQRFEWHSISAEETPYRIRGASYEVESAGRDWSVARATNASCDVIRFEVRQGDQWSEDAQSGENKERSEFDGYRTRWSEAAPVWGAYSFFIEPGPAYHSDWTAIGQMHGSKLRAFHIHFTNETLTIYSERFGNSSSVIEPRYSGKLSRNVWHNVVFHLIQSSANLGRLEYWLDGNKIIDFTGPIGAEGNLAYWKFGIYRGYGPIATPFAIQFANVEVGAANLAMRIGKPLPVE